MSENVNESSADGADDSDWTGRPATAADVRNCYRLFLAREAETESVVQDKVGRPRGDVLAAFVTSPEMVDKLGPVPDGMPFAVEPALLDCLDRELAGWLVATARLDEDSARRMLAGATRLEAIAAILDDPALGEHLGALASRGDPSAETYVQAIRNAVAGAEKLRTSALLDPDYYRNMLGPAYAATDPALHYLLAGERLKLKPSAAFDPVGYRLGHDDLHDFRGNLLLHYEEHGRREGRALAQGAAGEISEDHLAIVRNSAFFDEDFYRGQLGEAGGPVSDAAHHYLTVGEKSGLRPSARFDPAIYASLHPDIAASTVNRLLHYEKSGREEGRAFRSAIDELDYPTDAIDPAKPTVLLLLHEATHTGAPILGWNLAQELKARCNVVAVLRLGGTMEAALKSGATAAVGPLPLEAVNDDNHLARLARKLVQAYRPLYVIANSYETRRMALALRNEGVPIVALIHEFMVGQESDSRSPYYFRCSALVFPAEIVRQSSLHAYREIGYQNTFVIPQGPSAIPPFAGKKDIGKPARALFIPPDEPSPTLAGLLADGRRGEGPFTVIGLGTVELRKGIDLFIAAATALKARHPDLPFRFIWIGSWHHVLGQTVGGLFQEQAIRAGLGDQLYFFPPVDDLEPVYARADVLFLSSRLDPLPNISIDAALRELPILCFKDASGIAELLLKDAETAHLVAPHLDAGAIADRIAALASDPDAYATAARAVGRIGRATFDMERYAHRIDELGRDAAAKFDQTARDEEIILESGRFDPQIYFGPGNELAHAPRTRTLAGLYLEQTRHLNFSKPPIWGVGVRRPEPGFHPFIYGNEAPGFPQDGSRDAYAHFLEQGSPPGRWFHQVIRPSSAAPAELRPRPQAPRQERGLRALLSGWRRGGAAPARAPRVAMHGHFHYVDNIHDFMSALAMNRTSMDLFLTTSSADSADALAQATRDYAGGRVTIEVGVNIGRDIAPFVRVLRDHVLGRYDIVGHLHGKRSLHTMSYDMDLGNRWRVFLWQHLLGPEFPTADIIVERMAADARLGMVFPENDFVVGWEKNTQSGPELGARLGLKLPLPSHIDFPVGTMFWARPEALRKLVDLGLRDEDYPAEPLAIDGTMLHAIERLLPLICVDAGYDFATTYIPHIKR